MCRTTRYACGQARVSWARWPRRALGVAWRRGDETHERQVMKLVQDRNMTAVSIGTCVGSLTRAVVRFANQPNGTELNGHFEIVSLVGTLSSVLSPGAETQYHVHIALGDGTGATVSGHLIEATVYTTAELSLVQYHDLVFARQLDPVFGYYELAILPREEK